KHLVERGDAENLEQRLLGAHQSKSAVDSSEPFVRADENTEASGIEEIDPSEVDNHLTGPALDHLGELLAQPWRGVHVDLAADLDHRVRAHGAGRERQLHQSLLAAATNASGI